MTPSWSSSRRCDDELGPLDTSTVILLGRIKDPATLPDESVISVITLAELSVGPHVADTEAERIARQVHLQHAENDSTSLRLTRCGPCFRRGGRRSTNRWSQAGGSGLRCPDRSNGNLRGASAVHPAIETISRAFPVGPARRRPSRGHERVIECLSTIGVFVAVTFLIVWAVQNQTLIGSRTKYACKSRADPVVNPALLSVMRPPPTPLDEADSG